MSLSLKETALTSMTFFSCLARHHTPAHERALAPQIGKLLIKAGLEFWNMGHRPVRQEILCKTLAPLGLKLQKSALATAQSFPRLN